MLWQRRYRRWVDAVLAGGLGQAQIVIVDDGSVVLPGWPDTDVVTVRSPEDVENVQSRAAILLLRFADRLGRNANYDFPGWHRSFAAGVRYAASHGFERAIHLESDAYILSDRLRAWIADRSSGWAAMWSERYQFPEIAMQVICADELANAGHFLRRPYSALIGVTHETALPLTHVEKGFVGERYGEDDCDVPRQADWATQIPAQREPSYYWWLDDVARVDNKQERLDFTFAHEQSGTALLADGWARPEPKGTWMTHAYSVLNLPVLPTCGGVTMVFAAAPHVSSERLPVQRLSVQVNTHMAGHFDFPNAQIVGCDIPGSALRRNGTDKVRFFHPDGATPARPGVDERRNLALMLLRLSLRCTSTEPRP